MRSTSFFNFIKKTKDDKVAREVVDILKKGCVSYLSNLRRLLKGNQGLFYTYIMLHGTKNFNGDYHIVKRLYSVKDPVLTPHVSKYIDNQFKEKFGIFGRSGCLKVTADINQAKKHGNLYIVFPLRRFDILWSPLVKDLSLYINDKPELKRYLIDTTHGVDTSSSQMSEEFKKIMNSYQKTNLKYAMETGHEIMVKAPEYLIIKGDTFVSLKNEIWDLINFGK